MANIPILVSQFIGALTNDEEEAMTRHSLSRKRINVRNNGSLTHFAPFPLKFHEDSIGTEHLLLCWDLR